jgi:predicted outer membrane protein
MQQQAIRNLLEEIKQFAQSQDNAIEEEIYNTLGLLEQELDQSSANKTLQRALLANLRQFNALNKQLDALAPLLDLQLG